MSRLPFFIFLFLLPGSILLAQPGFPELVADAFGSDQELVNGIQFANQYSRVAGHPYFLDGQFRTGSIQVHDEIYEGQHMRYNLFSQRIEVEYRGRDGHLNQFMTVPEHIPAFELGSRTFVRMQEGNESPAYFQVISSGHMCCYIAWKKTMRLSRSDSSREYEFSAPVHSCRISLGEEMIPFHNRKTFMAIFPEELRKEISGMLKEQKYSFRQSGVQEAEEMLRAAMDIYEREIWP